MGTLSAPFADTVRADSIEVDTTPIDGDGSLDEISPECFIYWFDWCYVPPAHEYEPQD